MLDSEDVNKSAAGAVSALIRALQISDGILDLLPIAAFICDEQSRILHYNQLAVHIWGRTPQPGQTYAAFSEHCHYFEADGTRRPCSKLAEILRSGIALRDKELLVEQYDGSRVFMSLNVEPVRNANGELVGSINCFHDITERKKVDTTLAELYQHALEQEQRLAATYEHAAIGICEVAPDGRFLRVNEAICGIIGYSRKQFLANRLFTLTHPEDVDADREGFRKQVAGDLEFYSVEKRIVRNDGRKIWVSVRSSPVRAGDGHLLYVVRVMQDISQRKAAEERQKLLIDELNHRVKNTLATVQSLAAQTARSVQDPKAFRERFEGRLIALSKAHDQLTHHHWESANLRALLSGSLAPYGGEAQRVILRGKDIVLRPRAVLTLAMAVHELTTNAAKYGALSVPTGSIDIHWRAVGKEGRRLLRIDWIEQGGPSVIPPKQRSFGSKLIEGCIAGELGGKAQLIYPPEGLRCEISIPLQAAVVDGQVD